MGKVRQLYDGLANALSGTGTSKDKAAHSHYADNYLTDLDLINAYRFAWLPRKIVDLPALDATRKWRNWQAETADIGKIEALEKKLGVQRKVREAFTKGRLFGGAAIYIGTNQKDLTKPLKSTEELRHLTVLTRRQLTAGAVVNDPAAERYGLPAHYTIANTAQRIDPSRLIIFKGAALPDEEIALGEVQGWGDSVLHAPYRAVQDADGSAANIASLIFEAKIDVFKIPDLMERVSDPEYESQLMRRLQIANTSKSVNNALVMDANEDYQQKTANFSSLNDILMSVYQLACGAANIPATRVLGQSASGLNSTGDNEVRDYYDSVQSQQELEIEPAMAEFDELLINNALGSRPADVWFGWASLWQLDESQQAEIGSKNAATIKALAETKLIPDDALSTAAVTMMTESGVMPGLERAVAESAMEIGEEDESDGVEAAV